MGSLRDELLKAKLISKKEAKKAKRARQIEGKKRDRSELISEAEEKRKEFQRDVAEKAERSRQLAEAKRAEDQEKNRLYRLRDIVLNAEIRSGTAGNRRFYFVTRNNQIPCLEVSAQIGKELEDGRMAIVEVPGESKELFRIVSKRGALKLMEEAGHYVRFFNN